MGEAACLVVGMLPSSRAGEDRPADVSMCIERNAKQLTVRFEHVKHHATSMSMSILIGDRGAEPPLSASLQVGMGRRTHL